MALKIDIVPWRTKTNRFVVFLDIMGFKDLVARNEHDQVYELMLHLSNAKEKIQRILNNEIGEKYKGKAVYTTSFSDSIILFSNDDSIESFDMISSAAAFIFTAAMNKSIPMKGALAYGTISVDKEQQIYFGQPIIDAYLLQEEVYYYGIVCHNSIEQYFNIPETKISESHVMTDLYKEIKTPLKGGSINHTNLNWFEALKVLGDQNNAIETKFKESIKNLKTITSGHPRKYIDNTIEVFNMFYKK